MTKFHLIKSNSLESLAKHFSAFIAKKQHDLFVSPMVVVQTPAMSRWLQLFCARMWGVSQRMSIRRPEQFLSDVLGGDSPVVLSVEDVTWMLFHELYSLPDVPGVNRVRDFVSDDAKRFQLAEQLADLFDQYTIFRPEIIFAWEQGTTATSHKDENWQRYLWQRLKQVASEQSAITRDERLRYFRDAADRVRLDAPLFLFGVTSLPPHQIELFNAIARHNLVYLYYLTPSKEYFGDMTRSREYAQLSLIETAAEDGQPIIEEFGAVARHFSDQISQCSFASETELFESPKRGRKSLLSKIREDMMSLSKPREFSVSSDHSITVVSAPGPYRECEVLRDKLLHLFESDNALQPKDVVVMTPDIHTYAPYIDAVFGTMDERYAIPYSLTDSIPRDEQGVTAVILAITEFPGTMATVDDVFSIFRAEPVAEAYGVKNSSDMRLLETWVRRAGVLWGIDEYHRLETGYPGKPTNSWMFGIKRMILGTALLPSSSQPLFHTIAPLEGARGRTAVLLGNFIAFLERLFEFVNYTKQSRSAVEWASVLEQSFNDIFVDSPDKERIALTLSPLLSVLQTSELYQKGRSFSFAVVRYLVKKVIGERASTRGFISGGVTFCAMKPMRAVPFKVIALIGMNESVFPRADHRLSFDLMGIAPRSGDRSVRDSDRHLFLDILLSARRTLYISYTGRDLSKGDTLFPSASVTTFLSILLTGYRVKIVVEEHPLHPFSALYFTNDSPLFSYSSDDEQCARSLLSDRVEEDMNSRFIVSRQHLTSPLSVAVSDKQFARFFTNPARYFATRTLHLSFPEEFLIEQKDAEELIGLSNLSRWKIGEELLRRYEAGQSFDSAESLLYRELAGSGQLPWGALGRRQFLDISFEMRRLFSSTAPIRNGAPSTASLLLQTTSHGVNLVISGSVRTMYENAFVIHQSSDINNNKIPAVLVSHLLRQTVKRIPTVIAFRRSKTKTVSRVVLNPVENNNVLESLIDCFADGYQRVVPFLPSLSWLVYRISKEERDASVTLEQALNEYYKADKGLYPPPFEDEALAMAGFLSPTEEIATEAYELARLIYGTYESLIGEGNEI